jgi:hypothetical protein
MKILVLLAATLCISPAAYALNKCVSPNGKISYSDMPCEKSAKKAELSRESSVSANSNVAGTQTGGSVDAEKKFKALQASGRERSIRSELEGIDTEIYLYRRQMEDELARLRDKKRYANNNLAGATWEQSISAEMQTVTATYDSKMKIASDKAKALRDELTGLKK